VAGCVDGWHFRIKVIRGQDLDVRAVRGHGGQLSAG
jgi:hypothetical protein